MPKKLKQIESNPKVRFEPSMTNAPSNNFVSNHLYKFQVYKNIYQHSSRPSLLQEGTTLADNLFHDIKLSLLEKK